MNSDERRQQARQTLLDRRTAITDTEHVLAGQSLCHLIQRQFSQQLGDQRLTPVQERRQATPKIVAGYLPSRGEIDILPTLSWFRSQGSTTCVPVMGKINGQPGLRFAPIDDSSNLIPGKFNIPIPDLPESAYLSAEQLDLVLVPLVGFDDKGHRLGMGGGYYDRTFAWRLHQNNTQLFIGVAHDCQKMPNIPVDTWDVPLDAVATDQHWYTTNTLVSTEP